MPDNFLDVYRRWLTDGAFDESVRAELGAIGGDGKEIEDRFYKDLEFGTAGLRGILGAGTNRMNIYTVGRATQGLCDMLLDDVKNGAEGGAADANAGAADINGAADDDVAADGNANVGREAPGVVIAYDPRHKSIDFAEECALIIAANGMKAYLFDDIRPTPVLSFAVRELGCAAGIMITASHNPSNYNGYKAYGADGAQMSVAESDRLSGYILRIADYASIKKTDMKSAVAAGLVTIVGDAVDAAYVEKVKSLSLRLNEISGVLPDFKIIYTPLHGTGNILVRRVLRENGFGNVITVPEQELPDPDFSTVSSPNPEYREAFGLATELAAREGVDIIIGSDPDCDRIGVVFRDHGGSYEVLSGNQIGCLLMEYVLAARRSAGTLDADRAFVIKSIVTTKLANLIAGHYGVKIHEVYTGFKYICKVVKDEDEFGDGEFIFGFEESNGYLAGDFTRDKDGVIASMLVAEMAAWHSSRGRTLADALSDIYLRYGYTEDDVVSYTLEGKDGLERIASAMAALREEGPADFGDFRTAVLKDYLTGEITEAGRGTTGRTGMPEKSNVLSYQMTDGSVFQIRPSGTEPKIKIYYGVTDSTRDGAAKRMEEFQGAVSAKVTRRLGI